MVHIRAWYDEYIIGDQNCTMLSVWSIAKYLKTKVLKSYWVDYGGVENLENLFFVINCD